jgi:hypothetical protein
MAQKVQTLYIDDMDGSAAEGTVRFGLDGAEYEIDLSAARSEALRSSLQPYIAHARKVGGARQAGRTRRAPSAVDTHAFAPGPESKALTSRNVAGYRPMSWPDTVRPPGSNGSRDRRSAAEYRLARSQAGRYPLTGEAPRAPAAAVC